MVFSATWPTRIYERSIRSFKIKVRKLKIQIFCNLVIHEIANRQQVVYDGKYYYERVDLGIHTVNNHIDNS